MLEKNNIPTRRFGPRWLVGVAAAAVLVALPLGFALLRDSTDGETPPVATQPSPTAAPTVVPEQELRVTLPPSAPLVDTDLASQALLTADAFGTGYRADAPWTEAEAFETEWLERTASIEVCDGISASTGFLGTSETAWFDNANSLGASQRVAVFADVAEADAAMDAVAQPGFAACYAAYVDTFRTLPYTDRLGLQFDTSSRTTTTFEVPRVRDHGDRQVSFGYTTVYEYYAADDVDPIRRSQIVSFIRVGRGLSMVSVNPDAGGVDGENGVVERSLVAADAALRSALAGDGEA